MRDEFNTIALDIITHSYTLLLIRFLKRNVNEMLPYCSFESHKVNRLDRMKKVSLKRTKSGPLI